MASSQDTIDALVDLLRGADISYRKMFGEYAFYCDSKVVALVCDNQLFLKPTEAGRALLRELNDAPPYPGAKPYFHIPEDHWDAEYLCKLVTATAHDLPMPKPKKKKVR